MLRFASDSNVPSQPFSIDPTSLRRLATGRLPGEDLIDQVLALDAAVFDPTPTPGDWLEEDVPLVFTKGGGNDSIRV